MGLRIGFWGLASLVVMMPVSAGSFLFSNPDATRVAHAGNYSGVGGVRNVSVCLDPAFPPSGQPLSIAEQSVRNAVAEFNRQVGTAGNVESAALGGVTPAGRPDFESVLIHELGHCQGLDHTVLGPGELGCSTGSGGTCASNPAFFAVISNPNNGGYNVVPGANGDPAARETARGDDINRHWFRSGVNNPFEVPPAVVDRGSHTVSTLALPPGHLFAEAATAFTTCAQSGSTDTSSLRGQPATQAVIFPIICTANVLRKLSWDEITTFRIARAGNDGVQNTADDYSVQLAYAGQTNVCDIRIRFSDAGGFANCAVGATGSGSNVRITSAVANFQPTGWFFNQMDTTGAGPTVPSIFKNGFE